MTSICRRGAAKLSHISIIEGEFCLFKGEKREKSLDRAGVDTYIIVNPCELLLGGRRLPVRRPAEVIGMNQFFMANAILSVFSRNYIEMRRDLPIRPSEMELLDVITQKPGPHTPLRLSEQLGVSKSMITAHLTSLMKKGYVTREQWTEDKRVFHILPTGKALALAVRVKMDMDRQMEQLVEGMGQEDFELLMRLTQKANRVLSANRKKAAEQSGPPQPKEDGGAE